VPKEDATELLSIDGREVRVTSSSKLYLSVAPGALAGIRDRPLVLKRYVNGAEGEAFYQKRAPALNVIYHSNHGTRYASLASAHVATRTSVRPAMGSVGDCLDTIAMSERG
jgi:hypothetical protein